MDVVSSTTLIIVWPHLICITFNEHYASCLYVCTSVSKQGTSEVYYLYNGLTIILCWLLLEYSPFDLHVTSSTLK